MKKLLFLTVFSLTYYITKAQVNDEIVFIQQIWGMEKQALVEQYMELSAEEEDAFWELYNEYEAARQSIGRERINIISSYVNNYHSLTNEKASEVMNAAIKNNIAFQKLAKKTYKKMSKPLSPITAAKFMQLENYLRIMIQLTIQEELPFIGELDELVE